MNITDVLAKTSRRPDRKRCGRGRGSGLGKTSGRGQKGAKSRSGWKRRYGYEGGQMPLVRRMPKRGFTNARFRLRYDIVNLDVLEATFESGGVVRLETIQEHGILKPRFGRLKVLGGGDLNKSLTVVAHAVSASARAKVEARGGKIELLGEPAAAAKPAAARPAAARPAATKPAEGKPAEGKPAEGKPAEGKPAEGSTAKGPTAKEPTAKEPAGEGAPPAKKAKDGGKAGPK
jgi:large subunit ribosomal protein L15